MALSLTIPQIVIGAEILLLLSFVIFSLLLVKKNQPSNYLFLIGGCFFIFYFLFSYPLQKTFWGMVGDETFVLAFLTRVLHGQYLADFYYANLPPFYPPLYFWLTGIVASCWTSSAVVAAKIGVLSTIIVVFFATYLWQLFFWRHNKLSKIKIVSQQWFWLILPLLYFLSLNFAAIITKPYEFASALLSIIWLGLFNLRLNSKFSLFDYIFFGLSGGLIFLTYYFWWFIIIPVLFLLILFRSNKSRNFLQMLATGIVIFLVSAIYLLPLILSFWHFGLENWQARHFVPGDFALYLPWFDLSLAGGLYLLGLIGLLVFRKRKFIQAGLFVLAICYIYQLFNYVTYLWWQQTFQPSKPFMFLGGASLMVGASYLLIFVIEKIKLRFSIKVAKVIVWLSVLFSLPFWPMFSFVNNSDIQAQMNIDLQIPKGQELAKIIAEKVPDYEKRIWLSSGLPEINAFIPLNYYLAHNAHFSHQASVFSRRLVVVEKLIQAADNQEFEQILNQQAPEINALLLYKNKTNYTLFYWVDNWPNGGKTLELNFPQDLISTDQWQAVYNDNDWGIYMR